MEDRFCEDEFNYAEILPEHNTEPLKGPIEIEADFDSLRCPSCGSIYLHQGKVTVFNRRREDGDGIIVAVEHTRLDVRDASNRELPGRRNTITIEFHCEEGCSVQVLCIQQHKGRTLVSWGRP